MNEPVLELREIIHSFDQGENSLEVLRGVNLSIMPGEIVALIGPSGSGKSTLLQIAGLLEPPLSGEILLKGKSTKEFDDNYLTRIRRNEIGFVYQYHHLLAEFSARENIIIPQKISRVCKEIADHKADDLLNAMGILNRASHRPARLSGGEQQRVAIARALANNPAILLADEPTGNLDTVTAEVVFELLTKLVQNSGVGALIATHNSDLATRMDRVVRLDGGFLIGG